MTSTHFSIRTRTSVRSGLTQLFALSLTVAASAQALAQPIGGDPLAERAVPVISNRVLVIGTLTSTGTPEAVRAVLQTEVEDTVRLYLAGKLDQWFFKPDDSGVVFIFNSTDIGEVGSTLKALPLSRSALMNFQLTRLAPLRPLGVLLPTLARAASEPS